MKSAFLSPRIFFLFLLATSVVFTACQVGEEDPFLSFRSRDARLLGNWKVSEWTYTMFSNNLETSSWGSSEYVDNLNITVKNGTGSGASTSVYKSDGVVVSEDSEKITYSSFIYSLNIKKGGTAESSVNYAYVDGEGASHTTTEAMTDNWYWLDQDKHKAAVIIAGSIYTVEELRKDRLVLVGYGKSAFSDAMNLDGETGTETANATYEERMVLELAE